MCQSRVQPHTLDALYRQRQGLSDMFYSARGTKICQAKAQGLGSLSGALAKTCLPAQSGRHPLHSSAALITCQRSVLLHNDSCRLTHRYLTASKTQEMAHV